MQSIGHSIISKSQWKNFFSFFEVGDPFIIDFSSLEIFLKRKVELRKPFKFITSLSLHLKLIQLIEFNQRDKLKRKYRFFL